MFGSDTLAGPRFGRPVFLSDRDEAQVLKNDVTTTASGPAPVPEQGTGAPQKASCPIAGQESCTRRAVDSEECPTLANDQMLSVARFFFSEWLVKCFVAFFDW